MPIHLCTHEIYVAYVSIETFPHIHILNVRLCIGELFMAYTEKGLKHSGAQAFLSSILHKKCYLLQISSLSSSVYCFSKTNQQNINKRFRLNDIKVKFSVPEQASSLLGGLS